MTLNTYCRICGLDQIVPTRDERGVPSYLICRCCGMEAGIEDDNLDAIRSHRQKWLDGGTKWFKPKAKPVGWNLEEQLNNIPEKFRYLFPNY